MKTRAFIVLAGCLLIGAQAKNKEGLKTEVDKLKGTWSVISHEVWKGAKGPSEKEIKTWKVVFTESSLLPKIGDKEEKPQPYIIDPSKNPKEIDVMVEGERQQGIYKVDGDLLMICGSHSGTRPSEFKPDAEIKSYVMTLKRDKK